MSARAVIDSLEFAHSGQQLQGTVAVARLARLADSLCESGGELKYSLTGCRDAKRRPRLNVRVVGEINLKCQRCLGSLAFTVKVESSLLVLTGGAGNASPDAVDIGDLDGVRADAHTDVWTLVEDEVLLALPIAPRHAEGECSIAVTTTQDRGASPLAVLAKLKQPRLES